MSYYNVAELPKRERERERAISVSGQHTFPASIKTKETLLIGWINWADNVNWPPLRVSKQTFWSWALRHSEGLTLWRRANTRNVSFETLSGGQFTLSTQLIIPNYPVILSHLTQHHSFFSNLLLFKKTLPCLSQTSLTPSPQVQPTGVQLCCDAASRNSQVPREISK